MLGRAASVDLRHKKKKYLEAHGLAGGEPSEEQRPNRKPQSEAPHF